MSTGAVRQQYRHNHIQPEALAWFERHFPPSTFHGRIQIGRRKNSRSVNFPAFLGAEWVGIAGRADLWYDRRKQMRKGGPPWRANYSMRAISSP